MDLLKERMRQECGYDVQESTLDLFISKAERVVCSGSECVVESGAYSPYIWIVKEGIIRLADFDGEKERTIAFGLPGTIFMMKHSFVKGLPSYCELWTCCKCELLRVSRADFDELLRSSHDFAVWMYHIAAEELFFMEYKHSGISNGSAQERFTALYRQRPEIVNTVLQKHIASYLGVSQEYLCRLKRKLFSQKLI